MTKNELMLKFLCDRQGDPSDKTFPKIQQILNIKLKDSDDEHGAAGNHYVVRCKMIVWTNTNIVNNSGAFKQYEATCLVDVHEFENYARKENAIIWL